MPEFLELKPPLDALDAILQRLPPLFERQVEVVATENALGRVLAEPVLAREPLPSFARSTVDGYAVRATDTFGASESLPAYLEWLGEAPMGKTPLQALGRGQCVSIHTGGMLPEGADAIVMIEYTQMVQEAEVEILRAVAIGENVLKTGEDVAVGQLVIQAGASLRPAEIGGLMALGLTHVQVFARPSVGILSSGDELVSPDISIQPGQVRDINSYSLSALVEQIGGLPKRYGIAPDELQTLKESAQKALDENDCLVITAGSSASVRDLTAEVIQGLGEPGVLVHGVNVRPGKPTILAVCDGKPVIGLPGNTVSAYVIANLFVAPLIRKLSGQTNFFWEQKINGILTVNLASSSGREDWVPVNIIRDEHSKNCLIEPIFYKSNLIFSIIKAEGFIRIPPDITGYSANSEVEVVIF